MNESASFIDRQPSVEIYGLAPEAQPIAVAFFNSGVLADTLPGALADPNIAAAATFEDYLRRGEGIIAEDTGLLDKKVLDAVSLTFILLDESNDGRLFDYVAAWGAIETDEKYIDTRNAFRAIPREGVPQRIARRRVALRGLAVCWNLQQQYRQQAPGVGTAA